MIDSMGGYPTYCNRGAYHQFLTAVMSLDTTDSLVRAASAIAMHAFEEERFAGVLRQLDALEREGARILEGRE